MKLDPFRRYFRRHPALKAAYTKALERFDGRPGICGIGIGRPFSQKKNRYHELSDRHGGLCVKIFVQRKRAPKSQRDRVPRWLVVASGGRRVRVPVDVVAVGGRGHSAPARMHQDESRGWPTAGRVTPGRLFAFSTKSADETPAKLRSADASLGTCGALLRAQDDATYSVSAGHVFTDPCHDRYAAPAGARAIGALDRDWSRLAADLFFPATIRPGDRVRDAMAFRVPTGLLASSPSWPPGFQHELATIDDIERAIESSDPRAFVWVERKGESEPVTIPVDLHAALAFFTGQVGCGSTVRSIPYMLTWPLHFRDPARTTMPGDSGAGVYLWTEMNTDCRLLAFHFLEWGEFSYAMDAREFCLSAFAAVPGNGIDFV